jgi:hypothetical protein
MKAHPHKLRRRRQVRISLQHMVAYIGLGLCNPTLAVRTVVEVRGPQKGIPLLPSPLGKGNSPCIYAMFKNC